MEDAGGVQLPASEVQVERTWQGDRCAAAITNLGKSPVRLRNIILFDLTPHGMDPNTPIYGEGFQKLSQTAGTLAAPTDLSQYTAREDFHRGWQNGRLWTNDPDCVLLAGKDLPRNVWLFHATVIHAVGGLVMSGDKAADLKEEQLAILRKLIPPTGRGARFQDTRFEVGMTDLGDRQYHYCFNWGQAAADRTIRLAGRSRLTDYWSGEDLGIHQGDYTIKALPGRSARLILATRPVIASGGECVLFSP